MADEPEIGYLGAQIQAAREKAGLSRKELGERIDRHEANVGRIERGEHGVSEKTLSRIARALGITMRRLVTAGPATIRRCEPATSTSSKKAS